MARSQSPLGAKITRRRQLRQLENEKDRHMEIKAKAQESLDKVKAQMRVLRGVPGKGGS